MEKVFTAPLVIYHNNCADGFGAAWVFHRMYGSLCSFHPGIHGEAPPDCTGKDVILVDFAYPEEAMHEIIRVAESVTVLDHHISAIHYLQPLMDQGIIDGILDTERSGAVLAWHWCYGRSEVPALLRYIQDRDLWKFELPGSKEVSAAIFSYPYSFDVWDTLHKSPIDNLVQQGYAIRRKQEKDLDELLPQLAHDYLLGGLYLAIVANVPYTLGSDACHWLLEKHPEHDIAASYYDTEELRCYSLRSRANTVDVSLVAKYFGGGGHKCASGFKIPRSLAAEWDKQYRGAPIPF